MVEVVEVVAVCTHGTCGQSAVVKNQPTSSNPSADQPVTSTMDQPNYPNPLPFHQQELLDGGSLKRKVCVLPAWRHACMPARQSPSRSLSDELPSRRLACLLACSRACDPVLCSLPPPQKSWKPARLPVINGSFEPSWRQSSEPLQNCECSSEPRLASPPRMHAMPFVKLCSPLSPHPT